MKVRNIHFFYLLSVLLSLCQAADVQSQSYGPNYAEPVVLLEADPTGRAIFEPRLVLDINGDGRDDVAGNGLGLVDSGEAPLVIWISTPDGSMKDGTNELIVGDIPWVPSGWRQILTEDFNGDSKPDLFLDTHGAEPDCGDGTVNCWQGGQNHILLSREAGGWEDLTSTYLPALSDFSHGSSAGDFDSDGDVDLWINNFGGSPLYDVEFPYMLHNDGQGRFSVVADAAEWSEGELDPIVGPNGILPDGVYGNSPWSMAIDADNDGDMDLQLARMQMPDLSGNSDQPHGNRILINNGMGQFDFLEGDSYTAPGCRVSPYKPDPEACIFDGLPQTQVILRYDINNDGLEDLLMEQLVNEFENGNVVVLQVLISNGDGTFRDETEARFPGAQTKSLALTQLHDLDNDGHLDLFTVIFDNDGGWYDDIRVNDGDGYFRALPSDWISSDWRKAVLDVDGDGGTDFLSEGGQGVMLHKMILPYGADLDGTADGDRLIGGALDNFFKGFAGNDVLDGGLGDDWLNGGSGNDELIGGKGNDGYIWLLFELFGDDRINDKQGNDRIRFKGFDLNMVSMASQDEAGGLLINFTAGGSLLIERHFSDSRYRMELLETDDCIYRISNDPSFVSGNLSELLGDCILFISGFEKTTASEPEIEDPCDIGAGVWAIEARDCQVEDCSGGDGRYMSWDGKTWCRALITQEGAGWSVSVPEKKNTFDFWFDWGAWDMNDCGDASASISITECDLSATMARGGEEQHFICDVSGQTSFDINQINVGTCDYVIIGDPSFH